MKRNGLGAALLLALCVLPSACGDDEPESPEPSPSPAAACCPTEIALALGAPAGDIDIGTTGINYDFTFPVGTTLRLATTCPDADATGCGRCGITGSAAPRRCFDDVSRTCTADADCGNGGCVDLLAPPVPTTAGGAPSCILLEIRDARGGAYDPATGALDLPLALEWTFFVGIDVGIPCPRCNGAAVGDSGVCEGGARPGSACRVDAHDVLFGNTSFDCPPNPGANVGGFSLTAPLTTGTSTLAPGPRCFGAESDLACYCEEQLRPNACDGNACVASGDDFFCAEGPVDGACILEPYRGCKSAADCPRTGDDCAFHLRECLGACDDFNGVTAPLVRRGRAGRDGGELVAAHCLGFGTSALGNVGLGLPAAASWRVPYTARVSTTCAHPARE